VVSESDVLLKGSKKMMSRSSCRSCSRIWEDISLHQHIHSQVSTEIIHELLGHKDVLKNLAKSANCCTVQSSPATYDFRAFHTALRLSSPLIQPKFQTAASSAPSLTSTRYF